MGYRVEGANVGSVVGRAVTGDLLGEPGVTVGPSVGEAVGPAIVGCAVGGLLTGEWVGNRDGLEVSIDGGALSMSRSTGAHAGALLLFKLTERRTLNVITRMPMKQVKAATAAGERRRSGPPRALNQEDDIVFLFSPRLRSFSSVVYAVYRSRTLVASEPILKRDLYGAIRARCPFDRTLLRVESSSSVERRSGGALKALDCELTLYCGHTMDNNPLRTPTILS